MSIGVLVKNLGPSQLSFDVIRSVHAHLGDLKVILFQTENVPTCFTPLTAVMNVCEAYSFSGALISTDFNTARMSLDMPCATRRILFVNDLEWLRVWPRDFRGFQSIYGNPRLELCARSTDHQQALSVWQSSRVVGNFDLKKIIQ